MLLFCVHLYLGHVFYFLPLSLFLFLSFFLCISFLPLQVNVYMVALSAGTSKVCLSASDFVEPFG